MLCYDAPSELSVAIDSALSVVEASIASDIRGVVIFGSVLSTDCGAINDVDCLVVTEKSSDRSRVEYGGLEIDTVIAPITELQEAIDYGGKRRDNFLLEVLGTGLVVRACRSTLDLITEAKRLYEKGPNPAPSRLNERLRSECLANCDAAIRFLKKSRRDRRMLIYADLRLGVAFRTLINGILILSQQWVSSPERNVARLCSIDKELGDQLIALSEQVGRGNCYIEQGVEVVKSAVQKWWDYGTGTADAVRK